MHKVLLIDDDELVLVMMRKALEDEGYAVYSTADGPQGFALYEEHRPDLVLLDVGLPSMSGLEVLKQIRQLNPKARVIVVSGYSGSESVSSAIRYGAWDFVEKSIGVTELLNKVRSALQTVRDM